MQQPKYAGHLAMAQGAVAKLPAPMKEYESEPVVDMDLEERSRFIPKRTFLVSGILMLAMLDLVPIWNAITLMNDDIFVYFAGGIQTSVRMIWTCFGIIVMFAITLVLFFKFSSKRVQTEQTLFTAISLFVTTLGLAFVGFSLPLRGISDTAYQEMFFNCESGTLTRPLFLHYETLHHIRPDPQCASRLTIENCTGFTATEPYTSVLKTMEQDLRCSGFCTGSHHITGHFPAVATARAAAKNKTQNGEAMLFQAEESQAGLSMGNKLMRHVRRQIISDNIGIGQLRNNTQIAELMKGHVNADHPFPPTLFSTANYQTSCDGMGARHMKNFAHDIGAQTWSEGVALVLVSIISGFAVLGEHCVKRGGATSQQRPPRSVESDYGAVFVSSPPPRYG